MRRVAKNVPPGATGVQRRGTDRGGQRKGREPAFLLDSRPIPALYGPSTGGGGAYRMERQRPRRHAVRRALDAGNAPKSAPTSCCLFALIDARLDTPADLRLHPPPRASTCEDRRGGK